VFTRMFAAVSQGMLFQGESACDVINEMSFTTAVTDEELRHRSNSCVTLQQYEQATLEGLPWSQCDAQEVFETTHSQITWGDEQLQGEESHDGLARFSDQGERLVSKVAMNTDSCDTTVWDE
jgi:hypothetical protein